MKRWRILFVSIIGVEWKVFKKKVNCVDFVSLSCNVNDVVTESIFHEYISSSVNQKLYDFVISSIRSKMDCSQTFRILNVCKLIFWRNMNFLCNTFAVHFREFEHVFIFPENDVINHMNRSWRIILTSVVKYSLFAFLFNWSIKSIWVLC